MSSDRLPNQRQQHRPSRVVVQLFARAPVLGEVKTRLQSVLTLELTVRVHEALLVNACRVAACAAQEAAVEAELWFDREPSMPADYAVRQARIQHGDDLGARMRHAAEAALASGAASLIMGSDCPMLDVGYVQRAISALAAAEVVLAPAEDGGYALIGMRRVVPEIFTDMPWSTERVCDITTERLASAGVRHQLLPMVRDIDRPDDLAHFLSCAGAPAVLGEELVTQCAALLAAASISVGVPGGGDPGETAK